ncbi:MAG: CPBP family glutamic-type intramembrane protease, partial [Myxococcaceae bacterium]|nr:CPBP family glutamic-type intramembrane protease [Myxococcaceae bacterium]
MSVAATGAGPLPRATREVVAVFLGLTFFGSWPMWLALAFLKAPGEAVDLAIAAGSFAPAVAAWIVARLVAPTPHLKEETGLTVKVPDVRWRRFWALAWLGMPVLVLGAVGLSALAGTFPLDLGGLSGARAALAVYAKESPAQAATFSTPASFLAWQVGRSVLLGPVFFAPVAFGQEWGWRGWLLPRLLPLGRMRALALSGALWGLWLAPLAFQGRAYPGHPLLGAALLVVTGTLLGMLFGWLRLASRSVWPAVVAHGA